LLTTIRRTLRTINPAAAEIFTPIPFALIDDPVSMLSADRTPSPTAQAWTARPHAAPKRTATRPDGSSFPGYSLNSLTTRRRVSGMLICFRTQ